MLSIAKETEKYIIVYNIQKQFNYSKYDGSKLYWVLLTYYAKREPDIYGQEI